MVRPLGILTAVPQERAAIERVMVTSSQQGDFTLGEIDGVPVCLGTTGIGKVNAAITATQLCERLSPSLLVFTGVAGGLDPALGIGDVVVGELLIQHDAGVLGDEGIETYQAGHIPFFNPTDVLGYRPSVPLRAVLSAALGDPPARLRDGAQVAFGTILTGDQFLQSERERERLHQQFSAHAIEMEGGAVAQVAEQYGLDHVAIRTLSDRAGEASSVDFSEFLDRVARQTVEVLRKLLPGLADHTSR